MQTTTAIPEFLNELRRHVSGDLRTDDYSRMFYSTDASIYQVMPHGVLLPQHEQDVHAAVELAAKYQVPILPRGGGSSLAGQAVNEALVLDMSRHMNGVIELNVEEQWVKVQPGIVLDELNAYLAPHGFKFGPDPASSNRAAMGGIVSNNSTGSHSIMYGMTADHVLSTNVILSDGSRTTFGPKSTRELLQYQTRTDLEAQIYQKMCGLTFNEDNRDIIREGTPRHWRRCGGYNLDRMIDGVGINFNQPNDPTFNLAKLICGAEGTLATMTDITLNIVPLPKYSALAIVHFHSLREALDAVPIMLEIEPSAVELIDNLGLTRCRDVPEYARLLKTFIDGEPDNILITEFYGESEQELKHKIIELEAHLKKRSINVGPITTAFTPEKQADVWKVRKVGLGLLMSIKGDYKPIAFIEDAAVPVEHLTEYVMQVEKFCNDLGSDVAYYAHVSAGCLHIRPLINTKIATDIEKLPLITEFSVELLTGYGGSFSSEHGDGRARSWLNETFFGPQLYGLYKQVKHSFDPHNIFNPNNVVEAGPMTENLRYGENYRFIPLTEHLSFAGDLGFDRAVEMCNGAGVCRKTTADTMCPSFQATREEEHSTRGRANALRAVLTGTLPPEELVSKRMYDVMDLCISCKACKAECPSSVDMAKIKTEYMAHYYEAHGVPLRAKVFAHIGKLSKLGSLAAPIANKTLTNGILRGQMAKRLGIAPERTLPVFSAESFPTWFKKRKKPSYRGRERVMLLTDTYTSYNYPKVARAAVEVLEAAGFAVFLSNQTCVGRPALSKGLVDVARGYAQETLAKLAPFAEQNLPIVGLEPSDVSAIRDDYASLLPNDKRVKQVAANTVTFEEFIADLAANNALNINFRQDKRQVLLHGHCHQKALIGTKYSKQTLALLGYEVSEVDSGCCGMAGSFGYEAEHYDISLKMAERRLLPAVREEKATTLIVASGVSCRQQIKHGTGRTVYHSAELLQAALP